MGAARSGARLSRRRCATAAASRQASAVRSVPRTLRRGSCAWRSPTARQSSSTTALTSRVLAGAAGVHVGQEDLAPMNARRLLGPDGIVGYSTHTVAADRGGDFESQSPIWRWGRSSARRRRTPATRPSASRWSRPRHGWRARFRSWPSVESRSRRRRLFSTPARRPWRSSAICSHRRSARARRQRICRRLEQHRV